MRNVYTEWLANANFQAFLTLTRIFTLKLTPNPNDAQKYLLMLNVPSLTCYIPCQSRSVVLGREEGRAGPGSDFTLLVF